MLGAETKPRDKGVVDPGYILAGTDDQGQHCPSVEQADHSWPMNTGTVNTEC
jgi:hypothetical protein